jgi:uncharacterized protein
MIDTQHPYPPFPVRGQHLAVALALVYPTLLTLVYFVLLQPYPPAVQQVTGAIGKCVQFLFPLVWVFVVLRQRASWQWLGKRGVGTGLAFGAAVLIAMFLLYHFWLKSTGYLAGLEQQVTVTVREMGLDSLWKYASLGVFYALVHSLLEEYYWRWFVFGQLRQSCSLAGAIVISSLGFMAHHVVLLATFFGWDSPLAYLFSLAIAIGGAVWAWLYASSRSLIGPWLSHMLVDIAIFLIGYDLARALFR